MSGRNQKIKAYIAPGMHVHLVGIGGVSMRPLGLVLQGMGVKVSGSDMNSSVSTDELREHGIEVHIGHSAENIKGADCIIRTAAAHNDNPEIAAAREAGIPVFERAQAWGIIMRDYKNAVCVCGTHGKTTTTSMVTHVLMEAQQDPTVMIGGILPLLHAGHRVGNGNTIVLESCEYCDSFLNFYPTMAVVTNIEADHLDYFKDLDAIKRSFRKFAKLVPPSGWVLANGDDANTMDALHDMELITFGITEGNMVHGANYSEDWREFDVIANGKLYTHVKLQVYGKHNAMNALAAACAAWMLGVSGEAVANGLATFKGAGRRMEYKGTYHGAKLYDDYAHHPGELEATINAVHAMHPKRVVLAFQPHTYTRTKALFDDFVKELKRVDKCVVAEIYAARERNTVGISSQDLVAEIPGAEYAETLQEVTEYFQKTAQPGDLLLTVGAGDIYKAGEALFKK